jgi:hypothetical protein
VAIERVDQLSHPPVVGRLYLVPTVTGLWFSKIADWPVIGEKHEDRKFFNFPHQHYHLDRRFLVADWRLKFANTSPLRQDALHKHHENQSLPESPVWRIRKCRRSGIIFPTDHHMVREIQATFSGAVCRKDAAGWVCPHRQFPLGSIAPDERGVVLCPMHGLQIDAETGVVVGARL